MAFDYYYGISAEQYSFYRIPKSLMFGDDFRELSLQAKPVSYTHLTLPTKA